MKSQAEANWRNTLPFISLEMMQGRTVGEKIQRTGKRRKLKRIKENEHNMAFLCLTTSESSNPARFLD